MRTLTVILLTGLAFSRVSAQVDAATNSAWLGGLHGVRVWVDLEGSADARAGLDTAQIQTVVELRLRSVGIPVLTSDGPWLQLEVDAYQSDDGSAATYCLRLTLLQLATLDRSPTAHVLAPTFTRGAVGIFGRDHMASLERWVPDLVDQFANAYLAANPKR